MKGCKNPKLLTLSDIIERSIRVVSHLLLLLAPEQAASIGLDVVEVEPFSQVLPVLAGRPGWGSL